MHAQGGDNNGAGVIGLTLAKELASNGIDTKVYDLKESVSESVSKASGILSISGSKPGIPYRSSIINELDGAVLHAGGGAHDKGEECKGLRN